MTSQTQGLHNLIKRPFKPPIRQSHGQTLWKYVFKKGRYASWKWVWDGWGYI